MTPSSASCREPRRTESNGPCWKRLPTRRISAHAGRSPVRAHAPLLAGPVRRDSGRHKPRGHATARIGTRPAFRCGSGLETPRSRDPGIRRRREQPLRRRAAEGPVSRVTRACLPGDRAGRWPTAALAAAQARLLPQRLELGCARAGLGSGPCARLRARASRSHARSWRCSGYLGALAAWIAFSLAWSASTPETIDEVQRALLYLTGAAAFLLVARREAVGLLLALRPRRLGPCLRSTRSPRRLFPRELSADVFGGLPAVDAGRILERARPARGDRRPAGARIRSVATACRRAGACRCRPAVARLHAVLHLQPRSLGGAGGRVGRRDRARPSSASARDHRAGARRLGRPCRSGSRRGPTRSTHRARPSMTPHARVIGSLPGSPSSRHSPPEPRSRFTSPTAGSHVSARASA